VAGSYEERKIRLSPEANAHWERFEEDYGVTLGAVVEAIAIVQTDELDGLNLAERSAVDLGTWVNEVTRTARRVAKERRSRRPT